MPQDLPLYSEPVEALKDHPLFSSKHSVGVVTAENPMVTPAVQGGNKALEEVLERWKLSFEKVRGHYGGHENSYVVTNPTREQVFHLGRMFGQEAAIYGRGGHHEMLFTHGPKAGKLNPGHGVYGFHPTHAPPDYYTELPGKGFIRLHFDEDKLVPAPLRPAPYLGPVPQPARQETAAYDAGKKSVAEGLVKALRKAVEIAAKRTPSWAGAVPWHEAHTAHNHQGHLMGVLVPASFFHTGLSKAMPSHPHTSAHGTAADFGGGVAVKGNEQAGVAGTSKAYGRFAAPYGTVDKSNPSTLKHYPLEGRQQQADALVSHHGYQTYYAGGKHAKPDLSKRNYNTGHLMVYDPTAGSGGDFGDTSYTDAWRKTHELAHALTLQQLNQKYGEGRRMGSLGRHRTMREAKRAVEWEWLAAHKQRDLLGQMGVNVSDDDFHRELNCLDEETEALTQRGWVRGFELRADDVLLTKNPSTNALEWQAMTDLKLFPDHTSEVLEIKSKSFHSITTPNHRWLVTTNQGIVKERTTATLVFRGDRIHRTGDYIGQENSALTPDESELLGWFVTDGTYKKRPGAKKRNGSKYEVPGIYAQLCQSTTGNPAKCARIDALLKRLDLAGEICRPRPVNDEQVWTLGPCLTAMLLKYAPNRKLEVGLLLLLNKPALDRLREAMILGDGHITRRHGQTTLVTGRREQAEAFQVLLTMTGSASSLIWRDMSGYRPKSKKLKNIPRSRGVFVVTVLKRQYAQVFASHVTKKTMKTGMWCPVVPNTFFVARRDGHVWITGNTVMHDAVHRAVTGKFTDPVQEGFRPHAHKVPLDTALSAVDEAGRQMGLRGEHDLLPR